MQFIERKEVNKVYQSCRIELDDEFVEYIQKQYDDYYTKEVLPIKITPEAIKYALGFGDVSEELEEKLETGARKGWLTPAEFIREAIDEYFMELDFDIDDEECVDGDYDVYSC